nr:hypothetical protein [Tanacetum cinerariifolium]
MRCRYKLVEAFKTDLEGFPPEAIDERCKDNPSGIPCTMHTTQIGLRFGTEQPEFIILSRGNPKTDDDHDENLWIAKVFKRIGAFYRENETSSAIMYKDESFHVAMIEVVNIGHGVKPQVGFASMTDIAQPADGSVCNSDNGCVIKPCVQIHTVSNEASHYVKTYKTIRSLHPPG